MRIEHPAEASSAQRPLPARPASVRRRTSAEGSRTAGPWQLGCYTRPWDRFDYRVALDGIAEAGFAYAGIMTHKGKTWVIITPQTTRAEAEQVGKEVQKRGLKTISVFGDFAVAVRLQGRSRTFAA